MTNRLYSLNKDKDFAQVFKAGRSSYSRLLGVKTLPNGLVISRFGIIVSAKISKKAVVRNKIKRQIREIIRLDLENIKSGQDVAIVVLSPIIEEKYQEIKKELSQNFKRLRLYK